MQVNNTEINGFQIEQFNQYDLKVGALEGTCPTCSHTRKSENKKKKCASYDWERGLGTCHNCNRTFQLHTFKRKGVSEKVYVRPDYDAKTHKPVSSKVVEWFNGRGISQRTLEDLNVSEGPEFMPQTSKEENTIKFNYMMGGELINVKYRDGRKNFKLYKGAEKVFYNIDSIVGHSFCVITEGEIDVLALHEAGISNAISVPNGATLGTNNLDYLDNCIDYFLSIEKIVIAVDNDEPGQALRQELIRRLGAEVCYTASFKDCKDANEYLLKYGAPSLVKVIDAASPVPLENVTTFKDIEGDVVDFVENGFKPGFQIGLRNFDDIFSTYTGQFITVTGIPSSGKSDFVDQMVIGYNQQHSWKTAFASPENAPTYLHAHKLMRKAWQGMPSKKDIGSDKWEQTTEYINDNFYFIDMERYTLDSVLRKGAELVKRKGIKCLVIDPFNKVRDLDSNNGDVNVYTLEYKDANGKIEEPTMYNIKGGGEWYDASYHGLLVHRDYEKKTTKVKVLKVKFQNLGENGAESFFTWETRSGCYIPYSQPIPENTIMPWE